MSIATGWKEIRMFFISKMRADVPVFFTYHSNDDAICRNKEYAYFKISQTSKKKFVKTVYL